MIMTLAAADNLAIIHPIKSVSAASSNFGRIWKIRDYLAGNTYLLARVRPLG